MVPTEAAELIGLSEAEQAPSERTLQWYILRLLSQALTASLPG